MARPVKAGLDYYPLDVDFMSDEKVEILRHHFGNDGLAFIIAMWGRIYRIGSELEMTEDIISILPSKLLVDADKFNAMLQKALDVGLFDKPAYETRHVLTSNGIRKRVEVVASRREYYRDKYEKEKEKETVIPVSVGGNKQVKPVKEKPKEERKAYGEFQNVLLSNIDYEKLKTKFGGGLPGKIERLSIYMKSHGKEYKDYYATLLNWDRGDKKNNQPPKEYNPRG